MTKITVAFLLLVISQYSINNPENSRLKVNVGISASLTTSVKSDKKVQPIVDVFPAACQKVITQSISAVRLHLSQQTKLMLPYYFLFFIRRNPIAQNTTIPNNPVAIIQIREISSIFMTVASTTPAKISFAMSIKNFPISFLSSGSFMALIYTKHNKYNLFNFHNAKIIKI